MSCSRSPLVRSSHAAPASLVSQFASGNDFRDEASKIAYVPRSSKITTAQSKFTKEFAASIAQHVAHGKESHNTPLAGADVGVINETTKSRAHSKLVSESQENSFVSMQAPLTRILDLLERTRKVEGSLKQYKYGNAPLRNAVLRLEDPVAMGKDGSFRPYRETGALAPVVNQVECPLAMRGLPSLYSGTEITDLFDLAGGGLSANVLVLLLDIRACQVIGFVCTQPQDLLMSYDVANNEAFQGFLIGRLYEAIADRRWPVCILYWLCVCFSSRFSWAASGKT